MVTIPCYLFKFEQIQPLVFLTAAQIFCTGVLDVVVDGMIVVQSRLDPKNGSQDLQVFVFFFWAAAGMIGFILGGVLTEKGRATDCFLILTISEFLVTMIACFIDSSQEQVQNNNSNQSICTRLVEIFR